LIILLQESQDSFLYKAALVAVGLLYGSLAYPLYRVFIQRNCEYLFHNYFLVVKLLVIYKGFGFCGVGCGGGCGGVEGLRGVKWGGRGVWREFFFYTILQRLIWVGEGGGAAGFV
jgi:hypothetical protein